MRTNPGVGPGLIYRWALEGVQLVDTHAFRVMRNAFPTQLVTDLWSLCHKKYEEVAHGLVPEGYLPHVGSLPLSSVLDEPDLISLADAFAERVQPLLANEERNWVCNLDQAWVRRQYALNNSPKNHHPHSWHQDGALYFNFLERQPEPEDLLPMITCWLSLTDCGELAPGLELLDLRLNRLLPPEALTHEAICSRGKRFLRPVLNGGDLLIFDGSLLHRTYVHPGMNRDRTSVELRFFPMHARRIKGDLLRAIKA